MRQHPVSFWGFICDFITCWTLCDRRHPSHSVSYFVPLWSGVTEKNCFSPLKIDFSGLPGRYTKCNFKRQKNSNCLFRPIPQRAAIACLSLDLLLWPMARHPSWCSASLSIFFFPIQSSNYTTWNHSKKVLKCQKVRKFNLSLMATKVGHLFNTQIETLSHTKHWEYEVKDPIVHLIRP